VYTWVLQGRRSSSNSSSDIMVSSMINMHMQQGDQRAIHHSEVLKALNLSAAARKLAPAGSALPHAAASAFEWIHK
jgi:hypothetical protein